MFFHISLYFKVGSLGEKIALNDLNKLRSYIFIDPISLLYASYYLVVKEEGECFSGLLNKNYISLIDYSVTLMKGEKHSEIF